MNDIRIIQPKSQYSAIITGDDFFICQNNHDFLLYKLCKQHMISIDKLIVKIKEYCKTLGIDKKLVIYNYYSLWLLSFGYIMLTVYNNSLGIKFSNDITLYQYNQLVSFIELNYNIFSSMNSIYVEDIYIENMLDSKTLQITSFDQLKLFFSSKINFRKNILQLPQIVAKLQI